MNIQEENSARYFRVQSEREHTLVLAASSTGISFGKVGRQNNRDAVITVATPPTGCFQLQGQKIGDGLIATN